MTTTTQTKARRQEINPRAQDRLFSTDVHHLDLGIPTTSEVGVLLIPRVQVELWDTLV
jgi:hypothetical protein